LFRLFCLVFELRLSMYWVWRVSIKKIVFLEVKTCIWAIIAFFYLLEELLRSRPLSVLVIKLFFAIFTSKS